MRKELGATICFCNCECLRAERRLLFHSTVMHLAFVTYQYYTASHASGASAQGKALALLSAETAAEKAGSMQDEGRRILVVDDAAALCASLCTKLSGLCECSSAGSAEEAIDLLKSHSFQVVLTDIRMPGMSGLDLCGFIQSNYPGTAVIVMSINARQPYEAASIKRGAFGFLQKPFATSQLLEMVEAALKRRSEQVLVR